MEAETPIIYLDLDGVCNNHKAFPNGYCGITDDGRYGLNSLIANVPEARIVVSSAWRYLVHNGHMTLGGLENLLLTHGLDVWKRVVGVTLTDEDFIPPDFGGLPDKTAYLKEHGHAIRAQQILADVLERNPPAWVVLDDLPIPVPNLVQTNGTRGLWSPDVVRAVRVLKGEAPPVRTELGRAWE